MSNMHNVTLEKSYTPRIVEMRNMPIGYYGRIENYGSFTGRIVMKTHVENIYCIVLVDEPSNGWTNDSVIKVRLLECGDKIIIDVQNN